MAFECAAPIRALPVPLAESIGRTLARAVTTSQDLPHYASSAMDGWAVSGSGPWTLVKPGQPLAPHRASPIATGGVVPAGTDAVLRRESGRTSDDMAGVPTLTLGSEARPGEPRSGQHIRQAGEEAAAGEMLIPAGTVLNPAHIALAAIVGHDELHVFGKPRVTILLTGAEVVTSGLPGPGQVRDAFGPQLGAVLAMLGGVPAGQRRIGDSYHEWLAALSDTGSRRPVERPDVVITTGGTGRSGTDHFRNATAALGGGASQRRAGRGPGSRPAAPVDPNADRRIGGKPPVQCLCASGLGFRETRGKFQPLVSPQKDVGMAHGHD
ncbi:molybdopterin biosynthesis enzyme [Arthrobacter bambusae]|uniref:Molybdopterin molybdenumtransferase n=1 Tax=Arthrobacter bambusae TaxID=1338426 RepID=A0AAW8DGG9_9MICC|nr:molybdopterin biosynthesis enzyme [Arthrobacter bambusae]MDQ0127554.1 molybdopterin biosynthesis enzyme [Arthrobacter bambusae]MDQ0178897.1 molybdopterin biosynthesis enzyme [Arthrobacter bambusae]